MTVRGPSGLLSRVSAPEITEWMALYIVEKEEADFERAKRKG